MCSRIILILALVAQTVSVKADIFRWDTEQVIPGTGGITPGPDVDLRNWNTDSHNLRYADFSAGLDLSRADFGNSWLNEARFVDANLTDGYLWWSTLDNADFAGAVVKGARFARSNLSFGQLSTTLSYREKNLDGIHLGLNDLSEWDFHDQNLNGAVFDYSSLQNAIFNGANLTNANMFGANITGADLTGATITGASFAEVNLTATQLYSTESYQLKNLSGIDLASVELNGADLHEQDLTNAFLSSYDLLGTSLVDANLKGSKLAGADLFYATLTGADLTGATYNQWTRFPQRGFDPIAAGMVYIESKTGDFDANDVLDLADIELLEDEILFSNPNLDIAPMFDQDGDRDVDRHDLVSWVVNARQTYLGDTDLNGSVNYADFITLSGNFGQSGNWRTGDFDTNRLVEFDDFLLLSQNFGKTGAISAIVPEPETIWPYVWVFLCPLRRRRSRLAG